MSSGSGTRRRRSSPAGSQPRSLKELRVSGIDQYIGSKGLKPDEVTALKGKAEKLLRSHGGRVSISVHADAKDTRIECRVPSDSKRGTKYAQHIELNMSGTRVTSHECDCPSHRKSERPQDAVCKHVVAALLRYSAQSSGELDRSPSGSPNSGSTASSRSSSQHRGTRSTPGSTPGRSEHVTQPGSSARRKPGVGDVWGLLEPLGKMKSALRGYESEQFGGWIELHSSAMTLGKHEESDINVCHTLDIKIHFKTISTSHAIVKPRKLEDTQKPGWGTNQFLAIWDDTSTNGTNINGILVKKGTSKELHEGDRIELGKECDTHFIFHYPSRFLSTPSPGVSQRTEPLTDHSEPRRKANADANDDDDLDSLFGSVTDDNEKPIAAALASSTARGEQDVAPPHRSSAYRDNAGNVSTKMPMGSGSHLLGESDDERKSTPSAQSNISRPDPGSLKRSSAETHRGQSSTKKQRQKCDDHEAMLPSQGVSPTPNADDESQSQQSSQELVASIPRAPTTSRKRAGGTEDTQGAAHWPRRDSEPLVRETIPAGGRSPNSQSDLSDPDSGGKSDFRKRLHEEHREKMKQKQAEIQQLHDERDQMADELRKLRQASTHAIHQQEELLRAKRDLSEAHRQIKSLQAERDGAEERVKEQMHQCTAERNKRLAAESDLESMRAQLRRANGHALPRALDKLQEQLRRKILQTVDEVCDGARRESSNDISSTSTSTSSSAAHSGLHSDAKRPRTDGGFSIPPAKATVAPASAELRQRHDREPAAAALAFSTIPETLNQSDSLGLS